MSGTLPRVDEPGDAELISAVRDGDASAYGQLFERHVEAARRLARQLVSHGDVDDLVSEAFAKVLGVLQRGGGPDVAFRAYLLTAVRRLHVDKIRATSRLTTTDDLTPFDPGVPFRDTAVEGFENAAAAKAFASLPERWQLVLWHTEVEGAKPADVAALLGMSPNSVSALAYRAREGLRQAFLNMHIQELDEADCRWTHEHIGAYVRSAVSKRDASKVEKHLDECRKCMAIYLELTEVNSNLSGLLAPLLLGSAGAGYLTASLAAASAKGGILLLFDRAKDGVMSNVPVAAGGAAAAVAVVAVGVLALTNGGPEDKVAAGDPPTTAASSAATAPSSPQSEPGSPGSKSGSKPRAKAPAVQPPGTSPSTEPVASPTREPTEAPTSAPTTAPTSAPTSEPTDSPSYEPSSEGSPSDSPSDSPEPEVSVTPGPTPPTEPPPPPVPDLRVGGYGGEDPLEPLRTTYTAEVAGVPDQGAVLDVTIETSRGLGIKLGTAPSECAPDQIKNQDAGTFRCPISSDRNVGPFTVTYVGTGKVTTTFKVSAYNYNDPDLGNNSVSFTDSMLPPRH